MPIHTGPKSFKLKSSTPVVLVSIAGDIAASRSATVAQLAGQLAKRKLSATWETSDFDACADLAEFTADGEQDVALRASGEWLNASATRADISSHLDAHLSQARQAGIAASTLSLHGARVDESMFELLVKQGISALRTPWQAPRGLWSKLFGPPAAPVESLGSLRWGLWQFVPTFNTLEQSSRTLIKHVEQSIVAGRSPHLLIDLQQLEGASTALQQVLDDVAMLRTSRRLPITSLSGWVARQQASRSSRSNGSFLRRAA